jgi:hypothetical protein
LEAGVFIRSVRAIVAFLERKGDDIHVTPEIRRVVSLNCCPEEEVLQLRKREEGRCRNDVDFEHVQAGMVEEEGILEREEAVFIRFHGASVLEDINIFGGPSGRDV